MFKDPRIAKVHYRVKHVDKGLYFAGLKMLRCSATCKISGSIKGEKKFKGPHWHCYKCKNGFCRRDEALKHFETHFKLPQTTFQINIVQDVYEGMGLQSRLDSTSGDQAESQMPSASGDVSTDMDSSAAVSVTVDMTEEPPSGSAGPSSMAEGPTTVMIIQEEDTASLSSDPGCMATTHDEDIIERNALLEKLVVESRQQVENLKAKQAEAENVHQMEISSLRRELEGKNAEIDYLKKQVAAAKAPLLSNTLQKLVKTMQKQHSELLLQHIAQVRTEAYQSALREFQNGTAILTAVESGGGGLLHPESNSLVTMVLSSPGAVTIPVTLAPSSSASVVCSPVKTVLRKFEATSVPVMIANQQAFVQPQPRSVQQAVGSQNLVLSLAETGEVSQDMVSNGSTVVGCTDLQYQLPSVMSDEKDEEETIEECAP